MSNFAVPGYGTMTSTALTERATSIVWQNLILKMLGVVPSGPGDEIAYSAVRIDWPTEGQPDWELADDVAFIGCGCIPDSYDEIQEITNSAIDADTYLQTKIYTRVWRNRFVFYGPNSGDRARQVRSCMTEDFTHDTLAQSNLYLIAEFGTPTRNPELFTNKWWERWDFSVRMNEQVTETIVRPNMTSVEIIVQDSDGSISDLTVQF